MRNRFPQTHCSKFPLNMFPLCCTSNTSKPSPYNTKSLVIIGPLHFSHHRMTDLQSSTGLGHDHKACSIVSSLPQPVGHIGDLPEPCLYNLSLTGNQPRAANQLRSLQKPVKKVGCNIIQFTSYGVTIFCTPSTSSSLSLWYSFLCFKIKDCSRLQGFRAIKSAALR